MAEKILSQDEVDALLQGVMAGEVDTAPAEPAAPGGVQGYDLFNQERIIRGRMPTFDMINDRFIRLLSVSWTAVLRKAIEFSVLSMQIVKFGEVLKKFPMPSSLNIFHADPLRGHGLFVMDSMLVYLLVDHFFGGAAQTHVKPEGRDFTPIQQRIIRNFVHLAFADLQKAWEPVSPIKINLVRSESNPQFAMVVSVAEIVVAVRLQIQIMDNARDLFIVYPYSTIEPIKEKLYSGFISDQVGQDFAWPNRFRQALQHCDVEATVQLGTAAVRVRDLLNFTPGDVLMLQESPGDPLTCFIEGLPKLEGSAGVLKGNQAFRVTNIVR
jgi:flagellar motor switch protein FliM